MRASEKFPIYQLSISSPKKSMITIGSRKVYIDVSPEVYLFIAEVVKDINEGKNVNIKALWKNRCLKENSLMLGKRQIYKIYTKKSSIKNQINYSVNWNLLERKLEKMAEDKMRDLKDNPNIGLGILYSHLALNYSRVISVAFSDSKRNMKFLKTGMRQTNDWASLNNSLSKMARMCNSIETRFPSNSFFELSNRLEKYVYDLDFNGFYYTLRELFERLFTILFISVVLKKENINEKASGPLYSIYINYLLQLEEKNKGARIKRIHIDKKKILNTVTHSFKQSIDTYKLLNSDFSWNTTNMIKAFKNRSLQLPVVDVDAKGFKLLIDENGLDSTISYEMQRIYKISCSSVHKIISLPFVSLLEIKVAKYFLNWYVEEVETVLKELKIISREQIKSISNDTTIYTDKLAPLIKFYDSNEKLISSSISNLIEQRKDIDFKLVKSYYEIYGPSISRIRKGSVNYRDVITSLQEMYLLSYNVRITLIEGWLEEIGEFIRNTLSSKNQIDLPTEFQNGEIGFICTFMFFEYSRPMRDNSEVKI